jgi:thiol-disulfide isomerase/thioredoxin
MFRSRICASRSVLAASFLAALCLISALALVAQSATQPAALNLDGALTDPFSSANGKVVVLIFVRTDCPISNRYAPLIQRLSASYESKASFFLIYPDRAESPEKIRQHLSSFGYKLPALRDSQRTLVKLAQAQITPEAAVFSADRRLLYHGRIDDLYRDLGHPRPHATTHELDEAIRAALSGKTPPANTPGIGCFISDME